MPELQQAKRSTASKVLIGMALGTAALGYFAALRSDDGLEGSQDFSLRTTPPPNSSDLIAIERIRNRLLGESVVLPEMARDSAGELMSKLSPEALARLRFEDGVIAHPAREAAFFSIQSWLFEDLVTRSSGRLRFDAADIGRQSKTKNEESYAFMVGSVALLLSEKQAGKEFLASLLPRGIPLDAQPTGVFSFIAEENLARAGQRPAGVTSKMVIGYCVENGRADKRCWYQVGDLIIDLAYFKTNEPVWVKPTDGHYSRFIPVIELILDPATSGKPSAVRTYIDFEKLEPIPDQKSEEPKKTDRA